MTDAFGFPRLTGAMPTGRGYNTSADVQLATSDGRDLNAIWAEYNAVLQAFRDSRDPLLSLLTFPVTTLVEDVVQGGQILLERLSEFGVPQSRRATVGATQFGYDLNYYGTRFGYTSRFLSDASSAQLDNLFQLALEADNATVFRLVMEAVFSNVNRTAVINGQPTVYPVYSLYNGADGVTPPPYAATTFTSGHSHFTVSGAATLDSGDLESQVTNVQEHGFTRQNGATLLTLMPQALVNVVRSWRAGVANANGAVALYDFVPAAGSAPGLANATQVLLGGQPADTFQGLPVAGQYGDTLVVVNDFVPAGYVLTLATGGSQVTSNLVGVREHSNPAYRGLRLINGERAGYPLVDSYVEHSMGTGVRQRGAAAVTQVKASGSYDVPSFTGGFE